jgi:hypothetical protein
MLIYTVRASDALVSMMSITQVVRPNTRVVDFEQNAPQIPAIHPIIAILLRTPHAAVTRMETVGPVSRFVGDRETNAHSTRLLPGIWICRSRNTWTTFDWRTRVAMERERRVIEAKRSV